MISACTFSPAEKIPKNIILPVQTHSANIVEIITGNENLNNCDGIYTKNHHFLLGVQTADCAPVVFLGKKYFAVVHAGWRGLQQGILEKMLQKFKNDELQKILIAPLHIQFEVKKDECYFLLHQKFGDDFFVEKNGNIEFLFLKAIESVLPFSEFCGESTFQKNKWASWRRNPTRQRNITVVGNLLEEYKFGTIGQNIFHLL